MAKRGWKSTHQINYDGPSGIKGQNSYFSLDEAMLAGRTIIRARMARGPQDHVVIKDKSTGQDVVRWVGPDTLYVGDQAAELGYGNAFFTGEED